MQYIIHVFASHIQYAYITRNEGGFHHPSFQQGISTSSPLHKSCPAYIPYSECCTRLQYYWPWLTAFIFTEESWIRGGMNLGGAGEWKYSGVMLCAVSQGTSPAQWEVSHFVALLEETEEKERVREFDRAMLLIASLQEASSSQGPFSPLLAFSLYKDVQEEKRSERIRDCHAPAPWSQPNTDRHFSPSQRVSCSVVTKSHRSISLIFAIKSCCLLRMSVCLLFKFQTSSRFSEEKFIALSQFKRLNGILRCFV